MILQPPARIHPCAGATTGCRFRTVRALFVACLVGTGSLAQVPVLQAQSPTRALTPDEARPAVLPESLGEVLAPNLAGGSRGSAGGAALIGPTRVSGLSIVIQSVVPSGSGRQVEFDVVMSTERLAVEPFTSGTTFNGVGTTNGRVAGFTGSANRSVTATQSQGYPTLGRVSTTRTLSAVRAISANARSAYELVPPRGLSDGTTGAFTGSDVARMSQFSLQAMVQLMTTGPLPGVDFGDGMTSPTVAMTELVSSNIIETITSTYTPFGPPQILRTRYRRAGLSHTYADVGPKTIRVVSGCCAGGGGPGGTVTTTAVGTFVANAVTASQSTVTRTPLSGTFQFDSESVQAFNTTATGAPVTSGDTTGDTNGINQTLGNYPVELKTASVLVGNVLEIPTARPWGLAFLAVVLGSLGLLVLRRL